MIRKDDIPGPSDNVSTCSDDENGRITVAICTYNRHDYLRRLLSAIEHQTLPRDLFSVLIIDNSDDRPGREAFASEVAGKPRFRVVYSSPPGLSRARNVALEACKTRYIIYIDDDALPSPDWLGAILSAFDRSGGVAIAGPISPIWPGPRPDWLPPKYVACLTILDLGPADRWLSEGEFAYGANMAFRVDALREIGGFNVGLGRIGGRTLLSEEEIQAQLALNARGYRVFYAAAARVSHTVHRGRLSRNYFRARMAWQAVSALVRDPPQSHSEWSRREIMEASTKLGLGDLVSRLVTYRDPETFSAQLDLIYHLFALFLESKDADDSEFEGQFKASAGVNSPPSVARQLPSRRSDLTAVDAYQPSAAISLATEHLFIEGQPSHFFMGNLYATLANSQILYFPQDMWQNFDDALQYVARSMTPHLHTITFVTLDPLIYGPSRETFMHFVRSLAVPCFGVLHRLPQNADHASALQERAKHVRTLMVLAEEMADVLRDTFGVNNVSYLPLNAPFHAYLGRDSQKIRKAIGALPTHVVFSVLGEARRGKGLDLFLAALDYVPREDRGDMFILMAGGSNGLDAEAISDFLLDKRIHGYVDLRQTVDRLKYNVIPDRELGEYFNVSDFGLLLYQDEQRGCMSGVIPNYLWGYKRVIATADSVVGRLVRRCDLGIVLSEETPQAVAEALILALRMHREGWVPSSAYQAFRAELADGSVMDRLVHILAGSPS